MNKFCDSFIMDKEMDQLLDKIARQYGLREYKIEILGKWVKGENYSGQVTPIALKDDRKTLNLIVKAASKSAKLREATSMYLAYEREMLVYEKVFPIFEKFEYSCDHVPFARTNGPTCYGVLEQKCHETLILEDLKCSGFALADRREDLDHDHTKMVLENYGQFHAISVAMKDQYPDNYRKLKILLKEDIFDTFMKRTEFSKVFVNRLEKIKIDLKLLENDKLWKRYNDFIEESEFLLYNIAQYYDEKDTVIVHGDGWTNNMMFKYQDTLNQKRPTDIRLIDFQMVRFASPIIDLSYFLYGCCGKEVLDNLDNFLEIYHSSYCKYINYLGTHPNKGMTFSALKENWKKVAKFGLITAMVIMQVRLTETEEAVDFAEFVESGNDLKNLFTYDLKNINEYNERVLNLLNHAVDIGLI